MQSTEANSDAYTTNSYFKLSKKDDVSNLKETRLPQIEFTCNYKERPRTPRDRRCHRNLILEEYFNISDDSCGEDDDDEEERRGGEPSDDQLLIDSGGDQNSADEALMFKNLSPRAAAAAAGGSAGSQ